MSCGPLPNIFEEVPTELPPSGDAGGDLYGEYPNPSVVDDSHAHTGGTLSGITDASISSANVDGTPTTPSLRTLGTGAQQAAAGDDSRLSNARSPTTHASSHKNGGADEVGTQTPGAGAIPMANGDGLLDAWLSVGGAGFYGDGSDGSTTISGTAYLVGRDMFYSDLTIDYNAALLPSGYIIHVAGTLTIISGGVIADAGNDASNNTAGVGLGARGTLGTDSGSGGQGRLSAAVGNAGAAGTVQTHHNTAPSYQGGGGGAGGGNAGGAGGNPTARPATSGSIRSWPSAALGHAMGSGGLRPGGGGGGGGGGGLTGSGASGGGGGGGGSVLVRCRILDNGGVICAPGGKGGDASSSGGAAGGGGGGAGGWVVVCAGRVTNLGTITANGGAGGAGAGGGATGSNGNNGFVLVLRGTP